MSGQPDTLAALGKVQFEQVAAILGVAVSNALDDQRQESRIVALLGDDLLARRAIHWIPEAFAIALLGHMKVQLPKEFTVRNRAGEWVKLPMNTDPIFVQALRYALEQFHEGDRRHFGQVAMRSSLLSAVNKGLHAGHAAAEMRISSLAVMGIPAEVYGAEAEPAAAESETGRREAGSGPKPKSRPWWRRIFG